MASSKADMNDFFKKKKKGGGITKSKSKANAKSTSAPSKKASSKHSASSGSDIAQPLGLVSHGSPDLQDDYDEKEVMLRQFDLNMAYGPCIGMNRLDRWERAKALGLDPPNEVERLLISGKAGVDCLWDGRV